MSRHILSRSLSTLAVSCMLASMSTASPLSTQYGNASMIYEWEKITPTPNLEWLPCFDNYTCARLEVPLDYSDPSVGTAAIAYLKLAADNETSSTPNIQLNGGGPGVSGVGYLLESGALLRSIVGPEYNLIGFDPRGVNNSGPSIDCFPGNPTGKAAFETGFLRTIDGQNPDSIADFYEISNAYGKWCADVHRDGPGRYAGTAAVAADMLTFAEKQNLAHGLPAEEAKLWYMGGSYGTILGTTFAALYPDRVGRAIIDSVVDTDEYYAGKWVALIADSTKAIEGFFKLCHEAGPDKCQFWAASPEAIEERMKNLVQALREDPIPVTDQRFTLYPQLTTYEHWQYLLVAMVYSQSNFPTLARVAKELEDRNGTLIVNIGIRPSATLEQFSTVYISCLDAAQRLDLSSMEKWEEYIRMTNEVAPWIGDSWAALPGMCSKARDIIPPPSQMINGTIGANHTSTPMLFISDTIDAATAIKNARKMTVRFPGSVLLEQHANGHGVFGFTSNCTKSAVQAYLANGTLPAENTVCEVEELNPFLDPKLNPLALA